MRTLQLKMLQLRFQNIILRGLILIIAVQILNLSINCVDFKPINAGDISEFNDMNSIAEYVSEIVFGKSNSFPEYTQTAQKQSQLHKHSSYKIITDFIFLDFKIIGQNQDTDHAKLNSNVLLDHFIEINPPPPKA